VKTAQKRARARVHLQQYLGELIARVDAAHAKVDASAEAARHHVQCTEGCTHAMTGCCSLLVIVELAEAEYIVSRNRDAVARALPVLLEQHIRLTSELGDIDVADMFADKAREREAGARYHAMRMPCAFLDSERRCTIYRDRPLACRTHFVVSAPELCSIEGEAPDHAILDKGTRTSAQEALIRETVRVREGHLRFGTLSQGVLEALGRA
jgi:Fe-S-cluster containining protein